MNATDQRLPLVLIPGHMGTAPSWRYQMEVFSKDREIIVPDQHYSLNSIKDMALDIVPRLPPSFDLAGWSMGGHIAFELYPLVRQRLRKLVLISTTARPESQEALARRNELLKNLAAEDLGTVHMRQLNSNLVNPSRVDRHFKDLVIADVVQLGEITLRNQIKALVGRNDSRPLLRGVSCETLVIGGRQDRITPPECLQEIASMLPHSTLHLLDDVGHCSPWEEPEAVNALMRGFLG